MLALGKDPALKAVALVELEGAKTAQAQVELADQWRDLAETQPDAVKKPMRERALFWYRKSLFDLTGLMKSKAEMCIKELAPDEVASASGRRPPAGWPRRRTPTAAMRRRPTFAAAGRPRAAIPFSMPSCSKWNCAQVVLKKKASDQVVKIAFDDLSDGDQETVSDWTLRQTDRIGSLEPQKSARAKAASPCEPRKWPGA